MATEPVRPVVVVVTGMCEYQWGLLTGMQGALAPRGIPLLAVATEAFAHEEVSSLLLELVRRRVPRGFITLAGVSETRDEEFRSVLADSGLPVVRLGSFEPDAACVRGDSVVGMEALMAHLLDERGVRRPALVRGVVHQEDSVTRERVFRAALARHGVPVDEELILDGDFRQDLTFQVLRDLLDRRRDLDAVVALNDESALGALGALTEAGLRVPDDVVVTGFDNTTSASLAWPGLTTVDQDLARQGEVAVETLLAIAEGHPPGRRDTLVPSCLVVRGSTAPRGSLLPSTVDSPEGFQHVAGARLVDGVWMVSVERAVGELVTAVGMAESARVLLASQDAVLGMNRALAHCRTLDDIIEVLAERVDALGIHRCFLGVTESLASGEPADLDAEQAQIVLLYRNGQAEQPPEEVFPRHELLPEALRQELSSGLLALQPLSIAGRERGYLLFEPRWGAATLTEVLRIDLSRALDTVFSTQELHDHAANLEQLVTQRTRELERVNEELRRSLMRDGLTQIANRLAFQEHLERHLESAVPGRTELALLMVDVDLFKPYNDLYGHVRGDEALQEVATCLERAVREPEDLASRYGGEEFAVVLPGTGQKGAMAVAQRFRHLLAEAAIPHEASTVAPALTASIGIAVATTGGRDAAAAVIGMADQALYRAKLLGRDRIVVADEQDVVVPRPAGERSPRPTGTARSAW